MNKSKMFKFVGLLIILVLFIAACSSNSADNNNDISDGNNVEENDPDDDEIWVDVRCLDCGARWGEGYRLISCQGPITMYSFSQLRMYIFLPSSGEGFPFFHLNMI